MSVNGASRSGSAGSVYRGGSVPSQSAARTSTSTSQTPHSQRTERGTLTAQSQQARKTEQAPQDAFESRAQNKKISDIVAKLDPTANYLAVRGKTFCNQFAADYASRMGDPSLQGKLANQQYEHLNNPANGYHVATAAEAMQAAAEGKIAFAAYRNPKGHGHIAAVVGETAGKPAIAQAGKQNYDFVGVNYGFTKESRPTYFVRD